MPLPEIDKFSDSWRAVALWAARSLDTEFEAVTEPGLPLAETENHRGAIRVLRELLSMEDEPNLKVVETDQGYGFQDADPGT